MLSSAAERQAKPHPAQTPSNLTDRLPEPCSRENEQCAHIRHHPLDSAAKGAHARFLFSCSSVMLRLEAADPSCPLHPFRAFRRLA
jgi:hypothetical protein